MAWGMGGGVTGPCKSWALSLLLGFESPRIRPCNPFIGHHRPPGCSIDDPRDCEMGESGLCGALSARGPGGLAGAYAPPTVMAACRGERGWCPNVGRFGNGHRTGAEVPVMVARAAWQPCRRCGNAPLPQSEAMLTHKCVCSK